MVARRYDVNANQVFAWRKRYREEVGAAAPLQLVPVTVTSDRAHEPAPVSTSELIEIELAGGCRVRVGNGVKASALRLVLDVLDRR
jgi:transposase